MTRDVYLEATRKCQRKNGVSCCDCPNNSEDYEELMARCPVAQRYGVE